MFRSLPVVERTYRGMELPAWCADYARDTITLGWEERLKARGRRLSAGGIEFGTSLPRGTILREGDRFILEGPRVVVSVVERREAVFVIEPRSSSEWGLYAYQIGNGHQPLMITERALVCPDVPGVESLLQYHRIPYERGRIAFTPLSGVGDHQHAMPSR
jgi:urease accessory protein